MKRTLSYFAVGLAGGLLALGIHDRYLSPSRSLENAAASSSTSAEARYVNLPGPRGTIVTAPDFTDGAERTVNAVVHVTTEAMVQQQDPFAQFFWGYRAPPAQSMRGAGSGVIISDDGFIVTNNHVVEGADKIQVHLNDKRQFDAKVVGRDPSTDLALIKIDAKDLPAISYANSDEVKVGEWVLAVGNPMNLTSTVTAGIVSAKARNINLLQYNPDQDIFPIESFIQTDAAVNPGNSGGALVNTSGELVGINSAIASTTGAYSGYSFAIPANIVRKVTGDLMEFGTVQRAYIGVSIGDVDQELAAQLAMDRIRGVYVKDITTDGAAEAGGMKAGDVILKVGNMDVNNVPQLQEQVGRFRPGDKVAVTVFRKGAENVLDLTLRGREGNTKVVERKEEAAAATLLGAQLVKATAEELRALKISNGVKVQSLSGGKLRSSGIREGFIITSIDQQPVREPQDVGTALGSKRGGVLIEGVYPNGMKAYYGLGI